MLRRDIGIATFLPRLRRVSTEGTHAARLHGQCQAVAVAVADALGSARVTRARDLCRWKGLNIPTCSGQQKAP